MGKLEFDNYNSYLLLLKFLDIQIILVLITTKIAVALLRLQGTKQRAGIFKFV